MACQYLFILYHGGARGVNRILIFCIFCAGGGKGNGASVLSERRAGGQQKKTVPKGRAKLAVK